MRTLAFFFALPLMAQTTVNGVRDWVRISPPANAPAGKLRQYANSATGKLACVDESGGDCMPAGSGGGSTVSRSLDAPAATLTAGDQYYSFTKTFTAGSLANKRLKVLAQGTHVNDLIGSMRWRLCATANCSTVVAECNLASGSWLANTTGAWTLELDMQFYGAGASTPARGGCRFTQAGSAGSTAGLIQSGSSYLPSIDAGQTLHLRIVSYGAWSGGGRSATLDRVMTEVEALP